MFDVPFQQLQNPLGTGLGICFDLLFEVICQYCGPCDINDLRPWATKELNLITQNLCQKMFQNDTAVCLKKNLQEQGLVLLGVSQQQAASWPEGPLRLFHFPTVLDLRASSTDCDQGEQCHPTQILL